MAWRAVAELPAEPHTCVVYTEGWQSWSPAGLHRLTDPPWTPTDPNVIALGYRADCPPGPNHQGEGLLAVAPAPGEAVHIFAGTATSVRIA